MKTLRRILLVLFVLLVAAVVSGLIYLSHVRNRAVPDYNQDVDLENLTGKVTVFRDSLGIPHIYAENDADLYRTVGYVMAQDRLWQMDLLRRVTTGRLAEVLDPSLVDTDQLFRAFDFPGKSAMVLERTDPEILVCLEAFTDGINQYIESHQKRLPFEFALLGYKPDPWEMIHTANLISYMAWDLTSGWGSEIALYKMQQVVNDSLFRELLPDLEYHRLPVFPEFMSGQGSPEIVSHLEKATHLIERLGLQVFQASNNWAVSGEKSETGEAIMSNDMHIGLMAPGIWYQMHQVVKGGLNVSGVVLPGAPFVICGHNRDIAWGMTNVGVDNMDFYLETLDPQDTNRYLLDGRWREMEIREEIIRVKGREEADRRLNRYTHRGPVISTFRGISDRVVSARWQGNEYSNELQAVYLLNRAGNWEEFRDALRTFTSISQNIVYADRFGNIGLQAAAGIPIRRGEGILVYPGDTSLYDWTGQVPFEELPHSYNPESGYVISANNRTVGEEFPYYIGTWFALPYRAGRIREMIRQEDKLDTEDFRRMLKDQVSHLAKKMVPTYLQALEGHTGEIYLDAQRILQEWDYDMDRSSPAAMLFDVMFIELIRALCADELGEEIYPLMVQNHIIAQNLIYSLADGGGSLWCDDVTTPEKRENFQDNIRSAFRHAVDTLSSMYGNEPALWEWGDLHTLTLTHPLGSVDLVSRLFHTNKGPYPVGGSFHTVCPYSYPLGQSFRAHHGASQRHIYHPGNWDASLTVIPTGACGVPASPHYLDQTGLYVSHGYHKDYFTWEAVEAGARYTARFD